MIDLGCLDVKPSRRERAGGAISELLFHLAV